MVKGKSFTKLWEALVNLRKLLYGAEVRDVEALKTSGTSTAASSEDFSTQFQFYIVSITNNLLVKRCNGDVRIYIYVNVFQPNSLCH